VLQGFVVAQVALALALLVSAGLATRGAVTLLVQHDGYDPDGVMTFSMTLPQSAYGDDAARVRFFDRVLDRVKTLPDVEHAAIASTVPFGDFSSSRTVEIEGGPVLKASERPLMDYCAMTPSFFQVLRVSYVRGRALTDADRADAPLVAVVDQGMAERLWPGADPIGKRFRSTQVADAPWLTVVGVVTNVKHDWFRGPRPTYYVTYAQGPRGHGMLAVRVRGREDAIVPAVRQVVRELDPNLPLSDVHSLRRWRSLQTTGIQFVAGLVAAFAMIGLFLSAIGIYGVMAYAVAQRTREIGVRMALGATSGAVMRMTLADSVILAAVGIAIGLVAAFGLGKLLVANLFGVVQLDAVSFIVFSAILAFVALVAGSVPARRAMRVDPIDALRAD
jgi:putative ABC transport system permease protein